MSDSQPSPSPSQFPPKPPEAWTPLVRLAAWTARPVDRFLQIEAASGVVLLLAAAAALLWANSSWAHGYHELWQSTLAIEIGSFRFARNLEWFVNDALMVVFFFVVGMEIRREMHSGELSEWRRALLPAAAALGGMIAPAGVYLLIGGAGAARSGWGVPMATDIAFAVGVLALLGNRVPPALRVLLLALAVIDDLGAIVVIAIFYSSGVHAMGFVVAGAGIAGVFALQKFGVRNKLVYIIPGFVAWAGTYAAGVHPTIAGVIIGLCTPVRAWLGTEGFAQEVAEPIQQLADGRTSTHGVAESLRKVTSAQREVLSPVDSLVATLHPWVAYGIMPLFALANAGVSLGGLDLNPISTAAAVGAGVGLVVGKPLGICLVCMLMLKLGLATLPKGIGARHIIVLGVVAGIGFTMALFVAQLAFADAALLGAAKLGVLCGSGVAGVLSLGLGAFLLKPLAPGLGAQTAHEAETSTEL